MGGLHASHLWDAVLWSGQKLAPAGDQRLGTEGSQLSPLLACGISCKGTQKAASSLSSALHLGEAYITLLWPPGCPLWWDPCPLPWMCTLAGSMLNFFLPIHISFSFCAIRL